MGILDNVKRRLGRGGGYSDYRGRGNAAYDEPAYEEYGDEGSYEEEEGEYGEYDGYDEYSNRPASTRGYGVGRSGYHNDSYVPLVTQADVRSQPIPVLPEAVQKADRIPTPRVYSRVPDSSMRVDRSDDVLAFKNGLARTRGSSFAQLQSERLRMENTGRLTAVGDGAPQQGTITPLPGVGAMGGALPGALPGAAMPTSTPTMAATLTTPGANRVHPRVHRRIECIRPMTYADAEQVAQELRRGVVVVLDLRQTRPELAKRILDFSFGVASALEGQVDRHIDRVYIFARNGSITDEERASIRI
ncbi:MAG: cell division protein SepF [Coriobacteriales bacterium]|jgi:cell division inhibitor SepF|nr:cell division protein SepF [Coriobacteriales bacterium]